ncbi:hypothetical protein NDU88_005385 [Pleurodeles waltl]|uniref:Uncharacterized protein n=1 Tax=Pleurodeles waltl TaxID=8319 RepID=A0AAV7WXR2_PLEWA|nr:hypothetical protein NDU88_005385 [Pleurodeles waltl]
MPPSALRLLDVELRQDARPAQSVAAGGANGGAFWPTRTWTGPREATVAYREAYLGSLELTWKAQECANWTTQEDTEKGTKRLIKRLRQTRTKEFMWLIRLFKSIWSIAR